MKWKAKRTSRKCGFVLSFVVAYYPTRLAMVVNSHLAKLATIGDLKLKIGICSRAIQNKQRSGRSKLTKISQATEKRMTFGEFCNITNHYLSQLDTTTKPCYFMLLQGICYIENFFFTCVSNLAKIRYFRNFPACSINIFKSIMMCLTDADFKFNWSIDIRHHSSFVEASKQLVLASAEIWLKKTKRVSADSTKSDSESGFKILF